MMFFILFTGEKKNHQVLVVPVLRCLSFPDELWHSCPFS
uniref:Uncharacterized protein n=1 Tax=viral metagenome TaxID=1070528 RepID=A0A6C0D0H5_9ZZZZ